MSNPTKQPQRSFSKEALAIEINQHKVNIDRTVFKKNALEYKDVRKERKHHNKFMRSHDKLHMEGRNNLIQAFMTSKTPNWGNLVFIVTEA